MCVKQSILLNLNTCITTKFKTLLQLVKEDHIIILKDSLCTNSSVSPSKYHSALSIKYSSTPYITHIYSYKLFYDWIKGDSFFFSFLGSFNWSDLFELNRDIDILMNNFLFHHIICNS